MPQSLARVAIHIVFSTKNRFPFFTDSELRKELPAYLGGTCNQVGCPVIAVGGWLDHVHILCFLGRQTTIAGLVGELKRSSSKWAKTKRCAGVPQKFAWQEGYAAYSVDQLGIEVVRMYVENQEDHHRRESFREELRKALREHDIPFDERYIWD
jgi:REP element-mobilizing transposase RayT